MEINSFPVPSALVFSTNIYWALGWSLMVGEGTHIAWKAQSLNSKSQESGRAHSQMGLLLQTLGRSSRTRGVPGWPGDSQSRLRASEVCRWLQSRSPTPGSRIADWCDICFGMDPWRPKTSPPTLHFQGSHRPRCIVGWCFLLGKTSEAVSICKALVPSGWWSHHLGTKHAFLTSAPSQMPLWRLGAFLQA